MTKSRKDIEPEVIWEAFNRLGTLRAAGRELGMNHMVVRARLLKAGYELSNKTVKTDSLSPKYKVYVRPGQFEELDRMAKKHGVNGRHEMARLLLDEALKLDLFSKTEPSTS